MATFTFILFDRHLLSYSNGETRFYVPVSGAVGMHNMKVRLPSDVTCQQCVLQWRYRTGNSWGTENGESGLGLGQQEEFYGCADVAILDGLSPNGMSTTATSRSTSVSQVWSTTKWTQPPTPHWTTTQTTTTTQTPQSTTDIPPNPIPASQVPGDVI
uniref:Chitin-binding type-4 domain-containing protein n=1 Tax=Ciona savignyi TaxID=51511 RepID=H2YE14_CIOSA